MRGRLSEFGVVLPQSPERLRREITPHLDALPGWVRHCVGDLLEHADNIEDRLAEYDRAISEIAREDERSRRLMQLHVRLPNGVEFDFGDASVDELATIIQMLGRMPCSGSTKA